MSNLQPNPPQGNFLEDLIPASQRKKTYAVYGLIGFVFGAVAVAYASVTQDLPPTWLIVCIVVYNFASPFFSALATANAVPTGNEAVKKGGTR